jgi:hypothetical protein
LRASRRKLVSDILSGDDNIAMISEEPGAIMAMVSSQTLCIAAYVTTSVLKCFSSGKGLIFPMLFMVLVTVFFWIMVLLKANMIAELKRTRDCMKSEGEVDEVLHYLSCVVILKKYD